MAHPVKPSSSPSTLRSEQVARTERRIVRAATTCFVSAGYAGTSLAAVADAAGVAERTVYVRFGTKSALFKRVVDEAVVGDDEETALMERMWVRPALDSPTLEERLDAWVAVVSQIMGRIGALIEVAQQAAATEPEIAELVARGRAQSLEAERVFWTRLVADDLVDAALDLDWVTVTASVLDGPDTYVRLVAQHGWTIGEYGSWLRRSLEMLAGGADGWHLPSTR